MIVPKDTNLTEDIDRELVRTIRNALKMGSEEEPMPLEELEMLVNAGTNSPNIMAESLRYGWSGLVAYGLEKIRGSMRAER